MSANWYQNKLLIVSTLALSFLAGAIGYGMSTPRYALFKLGRAIDAKNLQQVESIIDIKAISKDLVDGVVAENNLEATQKISSGEVTGFGVLGLNTGLNALNNMKPALEALYVKQGQELLGSTLEKFSGSATSYLVSQKITGTGDTAVLLLEVPQNKMNLGLPQLEIELSKVSGTGWKVVGLSNSTIHALYENKKLSSPVNSIVSTQARISQCNQVIAIANEAVSSTRVITGNGQTSDPGAMLEAADAMDSSATKFENISLTDQTLQDYRSGFSKMYRETSQATRAFVEAFKNQDRPAAEAALTSLQQATIPEKQLTTGVNSYCAK